MRTITQVFPDGTKTPLVPQNGNDFTLPELQEAVGGYIERVDLPLHDGYLYVNETGKLDKLPFNANATLLAKIDIVGTALLVEGEETQPQYECPCCGETLEDAGEAVTLYECGDCGQQFTRNTSHNDNHQCPTCAKFGAKVSEMGCPSCGEGELEDYQEAK